MSSDFIMLKNVRIGFPHFFDFPEFNGEQAKAGCKVYLDVEEDQAQIQAVQEGIVTISHEMNEVKDKKTGKGRVIPMERTCIKDGDETDREEEDGCFVMNVSAKKNTLPLVVAAGDNTRIVTDENEEPRFYGGCRANLKIRLWFQKPGTSWPSRVNAELIAVQFAGDDDPLSAGFVSKDTAMAGFGANSQYEPENLMD